MSERLTDKYLAIYLDQMEGLRKRNPGEWMHEKPWRLALEEIRERRAADLTDEEREALREVYDVCRPHDAGMPGLVSGAALAVLDRLLERKP